MDLAILVEDEEIHATLKEYGANLQEAAEVLVQIANDNGGKDNISVILARILKPFSRQENLVCAIVRLVLTFQPVSRTHACQART